MSNSTPTQNTAKTDKHKNFGVLGITAVFISFHALIYRNDWAAIVEGTTLICLMALVTWCEVHGIGRGELPKEPSAKTAEEAWNKAWNETTGAFVDFVKSARPFAASIIMCVVALVMCIAAVIMATTRNECICTVVGGEQGVEVVNVKALDMGV